MANNVIKSPEQIRRVTALRHPPRTARMNHRVVAFVAQRARWQEIQPNEDGVFERDFESYRRHEREIVKTKHRVRRVRLVG